MRRGRRDAGRLRERFSKDHPGTSGLPGKWPANIGIVAGERRRALRGNAGLARDQFADKNERRPVRQAKIDNRLRRVFRLPHARNLPGCSAVHEVGELPAPVDTAEPCAVAIVIERFVGELRWRYHETALLHEFLRQDAV